VGAFQNSEARAAVSSWQDGILYPDLLVVHRTFEMRVFQASAWSQFVHTFHRNVKALYRSVLVAGG
jgi:hypothetical protein